MRIAFVLWPLLLSGCAVTAKHDATRSDLTRDVESYAIASCFAEIIDRPEVRSAIEKAKTELKPAYDDGFLR